MGEEEKEENIAESEELEENLKIGKRYSEYSFFLPLIQENDLITSLLFL